MIYSSAVSNKGLISPVNEDNIHLNGEVIPESESDDYSRSMENKSHTFLAAVFDGMGGEMAGRKASGEASKCLKNYYDRINYEGKEFLRNVELLEEYVEKTNRHIYKLAEQDGYKNNMGSTFACLYISGNKAVAMNLGNSRVYMYRSGNLTQISKDYIEIQPSASEDTIEDVQSKPGKHIFDNYLGAPPQEGKVKAYISGEIGLRENDIFIICSDGLTDMLTDKEIGEAAESSADMNHISRKLVNMALENGGKDNISVIAVKYSAVEQYIPVGIPNLYSRTAMARKRKEEFKKRVITITASVLAALVILAFGIIITGNYLGHSNESKKAQKTSLPVTDKADKHADKHKAAIPSKPDTVSAPAVSSPSAVTGVATPPAVSYNTASGSIKTYTVQHGDTLQSISRKFYGSSNYWQKIREDNKMTASSSLKTGRVLYIYPLGMKAGGTESPNISNPSTGSAVNTGKPNTPGGESYYIVKSGDSLSKISEKYYGTKNNYKAIMDANGLTSANALKPGQKLRIP